MSEPLKRHSDRVAYLQHFLKMAKRARSMADLRPGRENAWADLQQIEGEKVQREAIDIFRRTMSTAEAAQNNRPDIACEIVANGVRELIAFLEANDVEEPAA